MELTYTLILLPNNPIIVSDEELEIGDNCYGININKDLIVDIHEASSNDLHIKSSKIVAGYENTPTIDFSLLSENDFKRINFFPAELLFKEEPYDYEGYKNGWINGFNYCKSLMDKMFTIDDMIKLYNGTKQNVGTSVKVSDLPTAKVMREYLFKPKKFLVNLERDTCCLVLPDKPEGNGWRPAFSEACAVFYERLVINPNNSVKITKILNQA